MIVSYNNCLLSDIGELEITQKREFERVGDAPLRAKVTITIGVKSFARSFSENRSMVDRARLELNKPSGMLTWMDEETKVFYVNQTVTSLNEDLPEKWGTYFQTFNLEFYYYDTTFVDGSATGCDELQQSTSTQNMVCEYLPTNCASPLIFQAVTKWIETASVDRFDPKRSQRRETRGKVMVAGHILGDTLLTVEARREKLKALVLDYKTKMNQWRDGVLTYAAPVAVTVAFYSTELADAQADRGDYVGAYTAAHGEAPPAQDAKLFWFDQRISFLTSALSAANDAASVPVTDDTTDLGPSEWFHKTVRIVEFTAEIDQPINGIEFSFTAIYTLQPKESDYATVEATAEERDGMTGETFLTVSGKIQSSTEAAARKKLAVVLPVMVGQYGYDQAPAQQLEMDTTPNFISANGDDIPPTTNTPDPGDPTQKPVYTYTELAFTARYRKWRSSNQPATFTKTGREEPISFGNVRTYDDGYRAERFDSHRSERRHATGTITATGTWSVDPFAPLASRRESLLRQQRLMRTEVDGADGTLKYGDFIQVVRVDEFTAHINQAETGIDWTLGASFSRFPNEGGYATAEFAAEMRDDIETGDQFLLFSGDILAPNGALARAKLNTLRSATLGIYGFTEVQRTRGGSQARAISANGDKTNVGGDTAALQGLEEKGDMDDASFIRLTFNEEYRRRIPGNIVSSQFQINTHDDTTSGMVVTVYSGTIHATGATADAALAAARARADEFGADREASIDTTAFLKSHVETVNQRQLTADNPVEFVSLQFSFEYQSRMAAGRGYLEFSTALQTEAFGADTVTVSGYATGRNWAEAELMYQTNVRAAYATALIRNENLTEHQTQAARSSTPTAVQQTRVDFSFTAHKDKPAGKVAAKYSISISRDFLQLTKRSKVRGSVFALTPKMADAFATALTAAFGLGAVTASERSEDHDWFGSGGSEIVSTPILTSFIGGSTPVTTPITVPSFSGADAFMKLDFDDSFEDRLTGINSVIEMRVAESVQFSGTRWALQPLPFDSNGTGGISIAQPAGMAEGSRTVRGTVTAGTQAAALAWARRHRTLLTGDADGNKIYQPESIETEYEFAPRQDGIISGEGQNVRLFRVNFTFAEILPNYPPPA